MEPQVLSETSSWLALNKPAGWVINDAKTAHNNPTIQKFISENFSFDISQRDEFRNGIVHRIDKETSGVLLVAKDKETFFALQSQFARRAVQKKYHTLVHGKLESGGEISMPIMRNPRNKTRFTVHGEGREAETHFKLVKNYTRSGENFSELFVFPKTGRTHQIRVHLSAVHHPIVSDSLYLGRNLLARDLLWCRRMFLHAEEIEFADPVSNNPVVINAPLPADLAGALTDMK